MPKGDKYIGLTQYLEKSNKSEITLSFKQIESIAGVTLPKSAYEYREFWSNTTSHSIAYGWMNAGYKTTNVDVNGEHITFEIV